MAIWRKDDHHLADHVRRMGYTQRFYELQRQQRRRPTRRYRRHGFRWSFGHQRIHRQP